MGDRKRKENRKGEGKETEKQKRKTGIQAGCRKYRKKTKKGRNESKKKYDRI